MQGLVHREVHSPVGGDCWVGGSEEPVWLTTPIILCHPQFSASSTTILDEEPIVNRGLAAALLLCQNKGKGLGAALLGPGCCGGKGRRGRCWRGFPWSLLLPLPRF